MVPSSGSAEVLGAEFDSQPDQPGDTAPAPSDL
jgi:hypothetical protein